MAATGFWIEPGVVLEGIFLLARTSCLYTAEPVCYRCKGVQESGMLTDDLEVCD
jgi:hypothetical protein